MPFDRSDPEWTFQDDEPEEPEPLTEVPCPCCGGGGAHLGSCDTRYNAVLRELLGIVRGVALPRDYTADANEAAYCARCGGAGVVPCDEREAPL